MCGEREAEREEMIYTSVEHVRRDVMGGLTNLDFSMPFTVLVVPREHVPTTCGDSIC